MSWTFREATDHRLLRSLPKKKIGPIHQKPALKTNSASVRSGPSTPEPPCFSRAPATQRQEGHVPACSMLSEMRGSLGASVVWDETHSCSRLLACFLSPPVCCSPAARDYFPIYTARKESWDYGQTDAQFLNECKNNTDTQMTIYCMHI